MLWLYRLLFLPAALVLAPRYLWRMRRRGGYRTDFAHRLGSHPRLPSASRPRVWLQAVSVGEMLAIAPLLEALHRDGVETYLTTTTSTGHRLARERYSHLITGLGYFPLDWWPFSVRAWRRISPDLVILTEGERWPEHLHQAALRGVPALCINARLSDRSARRLRLFPPAARLMFRDLTRLLPASQDDATQFLVLGVPPERLTLTGNIKLDVRIPSLDASEHTQLRCELGLPPGHLILLGSSTWPGEEEALVTALLHARQAGIPCSLLLVPRHAERRDGLERLLSSSGLRFHFRSRGPSPGEVDIAIADTTGELRRLTQLADLVFIGKSLPPHTEGQTPVEAAALGRPILLGPGMGNFRAITRDLLAAGAARSVHDADHLSRTITELLRDPATRASLSHAALQWHATNSGAIDRTLAVIRAEITRRTTPLSAPSVAQK